MGINQCIYKKMKDISSMTFQHGYTCGFLSYHIQVHRCKFPLKLSECILKLTKDYPNQYCC
eukprot:GAHX01010122.1.p1 GENE.GAHX01010122.1~~GAHX01010122.1.p1  ORF type:complete len:61 (+),score=4.96 GAHX01010122.1:38-220(+)